MLAVLSVNDWEDGVFRRAGNFRTDANNQILFQTEDVNNRFSMQYIAGGTAENIQVNGLTFTGLFMPLITWDTTADEVKAYINAVQQSTTRTGLGTWVGALTSTDCTVGARTTAADLPWDGGIAYWALFDEVLTQSEINAIYQASGI
ncbi:MAG: LamG-like jellyroll fold domain-containing protein [Planctomycetota bacterium]